MGPEGGVRTRAESRESPHDNCEYHTGYGRRPGAGQRWRVLKPGAGGGGDRLGWTQARCASLPGSVGSWPTPTGQPRDPMSERKPVSQLGGGLSALLCLHGGFPPCPLPPSLEEKPPPNPPVGARPPEEGCRGGSQPLCFPFFSFLEAPPWPPAAAAALVLLAEAGAVGRAAPSCALESESAS